MSADLLLSLYSVTLSASLKQRCSVVKAATVRNAAEVESNSLKAQVPTSVSVSLKSALTSPYSERPSRFWAAGDFWDKDVLT